LWLAGKTSVFVGWRLKRVIRRLHRVRSLQIPPLVNYNFLLNGAPYVNEKKLINT
jgi:hypothetical protein